MVKVSSFRSVAIWGLISKGSSSLFTLIIQLMIIIQFTENGAGNLFYLLALSMFAYSVADSLILMPMSIKAWDSGEIDYSILKAGFLLAPFISIVIAITITLVGGLFINLGETWLLSHAVFTTAIFSFVLCFKETIVRAFNTSGQNSYAAGVNLSSLVIFLAILWMVPNFTEINENNILLFASLACGIVSVLYGKFSWYSFPSLKFSVLISLGIRCIQGGRWFFINSVGYWLRSFSYTLLGIGNLGADNVGRMAAARTCVVPSLILIQALSQVFLPRLARDRQRESASVSHQLATLTSIILLLILVYILAIFGLMKIEIDAISVFFEKIDPILLSLWFVIAFLSACRIGFDIELKISSNYRLSAFISIVCGALVFSLSLVFVQQWGMIGLLVSIIIGEVFFAIFQAWNYFNLRRYSKE
jgi:O-antigen/teichoic acid export membrane protein